MIIEIRVICEDAIPPQYVRQLAEQLKDLIYDDQEAENTVKDVIYEVKPNA